MRDFWRVVAAGVFWALAALNAHSQPNAALPAVQGQCPPGFTAKNNWGMKCYADQPQACPAGTTFAPGRGCAAAVLCPAGYVAADGVCRPSAASACPAGTTAAQAPGGGVICTTPLRPSCGPDEKPNSGGTTAAAGTFCLQSPACPAGSVLQGRSCVVSRACPAGMTLGADGNCAAVPGCPPGTTFSSTHGLCVAQPVCPAGSKVSGDRCAVASACPAGATQLSNGQCASSAPPACTWPMTMAPEGICVRPVGCPTGFTRDGTSDRCVGSPPVSPTCPAGYSMQTVQGKSACVTSPPACLTVQGWGPTFLDVNNATCNMPLKCGGFGGAVRFDADPSGSCRR